MRTALAVIAIAVSTSAFSAQLPTDPGKPAHLDAQAQGWQSGPQPVNGIVSDLVPEGVPRPTVVSMDMALRAYLVGAVSVIGKSPDGFSYKICLDPPALDRTLAENADARGMIGAIAPSESATLSAWVLRNRAAWEAWVRTEPDHTGMTLSDLTENLRLHLYQSADRTEELRGVLRAAATRAGLAVAGDLEAQSVAGIAAATPECTAFPCCGDTEDKKCGSCSTHPCDCGVCGAGRSCSCKQSQGQDYCFPPANACTVDVPATTRGTRTQTLDLGW